jgi:hypothetical protein
MLKTLTRRIALLSVARLNGKATQVPTPRWLRIIEMASGDLDAVLRSLDTTAEGLDSTQALLRRARCGPNEVAHEIETCYPSSRDLRPCRLRRCVEVAKSA